jgi:signal transduction histidine kinase
LRTLPWSSSGARASGRRDRLVNHPARLTRSRYAPIACARALRERATREGRLLDFNLATTVSFASASTCVSAAALGAYLGRAPGSRHYVFVAFAAVAAAAFCVTDACVAGGLSVGPTVWAGRASLLSASLHGAAWLLFLAGWDRRPLSRLERALIAVGVLGGLLALVPGLAIEETVTERSFHWLRVTYRDPVTGPMVGPILAVAYVEHVVASITALRMSRRVPKARMVGVALALLSVVMPIDALSGLRLAELPYLVDPVLALVFIAIGAAVMADAAESAAKSAELERARVALAERENLAALGQLAGVVAHEVRNPVAIIFTALATLQRGARSEEDGKLLGIVGEEAERLKQLVARLLDAVRPFELQYTRRDAGQIVRAAIAQVTEGTGVTAAEVVLEGAPGAEVECDAILLGQAISNLVQNALVAQGRRSPVRVRATVEPEAEPATLCIEVADDGDGVPLEVRPRLFTPFFTTRATGTGLGLALVRRIAGAHGGTVEFEPPSEGGASFVLRVPLRARDVTPKRLLGDEVR